MFKNLSERAKREEAELHDEVQGGGAGGGADQGGERRKRLEGR